jgi:hypothetical protein
MKAEGGVMRRWILVFILIGLALTLTDIAAVECGQRRGTAPPPATAPIASPR